MQNSEFQTVQLTETEIELLKDFNVEKMEQRLEMEVITTASAGWFAPHEPGDGGFFVKGIFPF